MVRRLTTFFGSKRLAEFNEKHKCDILSIMRISPFDLKGLAEYIQLGNPSIKDIDGAYAKLDDYLSVSEDRSPLTAWLDLIGDIELEFHVLRNLGLGYNKFRSAVEDAFTTYGDEAVNILNNFADVVESGANSIGSSVTSTVDEPSNLGDVDTVDTVDA